jgi:putative ABC transport system permease protein
MGLAPTVRAALREIDSAVAMANVRNLERTLADSGAQISFALVLLILAAVTALLLGAVGIYGVIAYTVRRRTGEIGVRLALGARPRDVVRMIVRQSFIAVGIGLVLGLPAAAAFGTFMDATLFGVRPLDPATYAAVLVTLALLAAAAAWIPARRAAALDAVSALRAD